MKLAFSTNAYTRFGLIDAIRDIAAAGFEGVEILADVPHAWPAGLLEPWTWVWQFTQLRPISRLLRCASAVAS